MKTIQKVTLVAMLVGEDSRSAALAALNLPKSTLRRYSVQVLVLPPAPESELRGETCPFAAGFGGNRTLAYGYQRTTTKLRKTYQKHVNHKTVQSLHQLYGLALLRTTRALKPVAFTRSLWRGRRAG